jgi:hydrogenase nickel incorporation protein HypA/HybF
MHETGIVRDMIHRLEQLARDAGAARICGVDVWLGALSSFSPTHFRQHFDEASHGTLVQTAVLRIEASQDIADGNAQSVMIRGVELEMPPPLEMSPPSAPPQS